MYYHVPPTPHVELQNVQPNSEQNQVHTQKSLLITNKKEAQKTLFADHNLTTLTEASKSFSPEKPLFVNSYIHTVNQEENFSLSPSLDVSTSIAPEQVNYLTDVSLSDQVAETASVKDDDLVNPQLINISLDSELNQLSNNFLHNDVNDDLLNPPILLAQSNSQPQTPASNTPVVNILNPTAGSVLLGISSSVILQYPLGATVELKVNGKLVDSSLIGRTEANSETKTVVQTWYGVIFSLGENTVTATATFNGVKGSPTTIIVNVPGEATKLEVSTVEARIPADGRSTAKIVGRLLDDKGNQINDDAVITLDTSAGEFIGVDQNPDTPGFQVKANDGKFEATLRSGLDAQTVRIRAKSLTLEAFTQMQFDTSLRVTPLLTGFLDIRFGKGGTNYYGRFRDFLPRNGDDDWELDLTSAGFITGSIGEWTYTGAFNSDRPLNEDCDCNNNLFGTSSNSDNLYPVYGDSSTSKFLTPSTDQIYFRIERSGKEVGADPDYFMWGDYDTAEFSTASQEYSSITRNLHGFKGNYNFGDLQITAFYGNNVEGFQRDSIAPDGTRGYYFLSRRLVRAGSEDIFIELEELDSPGKVLQRERLSRGLDYDIDYDRGTILFKEPILRTDVDDLANVLVRRIVVTYEYENNEDDTDIIGGRVRYHFNRELGKESWLGATYLNEDKGEHDFELYGFDAFISLGENGSLIAEYAHSSNFSEFDGKVSGEAYRLELQGNITDSIFGRAYYNSTTTGFTNNATVSFVPGQTRYGAEIDAKLSPTTSLKFSYEHEENKGVAPRILNELEEFLDPLAEPIPGTEVDNSLDTIRLGIQQLIGKGTLNVDWIYRDREDRISPNDLNSTSSQIRSTFNYPITDKLTFKALNEFSLGDADTVYSDRTALGLSWQMFPGIALNLSQTWYTKGRFAGESITNLSLDGNHEYALFKDTFITGRYGLTGGTNDLDLYGAIGIKQGITLAPGLKMNLAYEYIFGGDNNRNATGVQFSQPFAPSQGASALAFNGGHSYSIGVEYTDNPNFKASALLEYRTSSQGSNLVISANAAGKISPALTALLSYNQASSANNGLEDLGDTINLNFGLGYRDPNDDRFNALLRYEYRKNPSVIPETLLFGNGTGSSEHVFSLEALYTPNWRWEFYGKYALRHSTTYLADDFVASGLVTLAQFRTSYRLNYNIDLVGEVRWISQPSANYNEFGFLLEAGYYITPELRVYAGYSLGKVDDDDFDASRSSNSPYVGVMVKFNGLFQGLNQTKPQLTPEEKESNSLSQSQTNQEE